MAQRIGSSEAKAFVDEHYKKVARRWKERVTDAPFMQKLRSGELPRDALRTFFKNWGAYTIEINTMGHGSFRRIVLQRLMEDGMAEVRTGYSLEYCGLTAVDLHGTILQAALNAAERKGA